MTKHLHGHIIPYVLCVLFAAIPASCSRLAHETNTSTTEDSAATAEIWAIQLLAIQGEQTILHYIMSDTTQWVQHEFGWWYRWERHNTDADLLLQAHEPNEIMIHEQVYSLQGDLLVDAVRENNDKPLCYGLMLKEISQHDTLLMAIPWYLAYGKEGTAVIPPYTNVIVRLTAWDTY